jgi:hypothetical protein
MTDNDNDKREAFDHMTVNEQDSFLLAIGLAMVECAIDELDRKDAAANTGVDSATPDEGIRRRWRKRR